MQLTELPLTIKIPFYMMKYFCWLLIFCFQVSNAQKLKKADKIIIANLQIHISYLADDKLMMTRPSASTPSTLRRKRSLMV